MSDDNQRELAQLEQRTEAGSGPDLALVIVEVVGRDHLGRINQTRRFNEATAEALASNPQLLLGAVPAAYAILANRMIQGSDGS